MDYDRAKTEVGLACEKNLDSYIQSYVLPKEHRVVRFVRNSVGDFDSCTSCQAYHESISLKAPDGTKPQQNIHRYAVKMVNKAEHIYQVKASVSGRATVATELCSKPSAAQSLTRIAEILYSAQVTYKNNYFVKKCVNSYCFFWWPRKLN
jgi:hypothetical protein